MIVAAPLLIALLLPGCAASIADEELDQGQQRGLLEALQKLRLLNLGSGRLIRKRDSEAPALPPPGRQVKAEQLSLDAVLAGKGKAVSQDLDSLLRNRMKRDQSLMVQINVFNSAGKGCWKRKKVPPHSAKLRPEVTAASESSTAAPSSEETQSKTSALLSEQSTLTMSSLGSQPPTATPLLAVNESGTNYNRSQSGIKQVTYDTLVSKPSLLRKVQGKQYFNTSAGSVTSTPIASMSYSYSEEYPLTLVDQLFPRSNVTYSRTTTVAPMWKPLRPEPFFPNQNFNPENIKGTSNIAFGHAGGLNRNPPPLMKITVPAMVPADRPADNMQQPDAGTTMYYPVEALETAQDGPCEDTYGDGFNCDGDRQMYRAKASGNPGSPFDVLIGSVAAAVGAKSWQRSGAVGGKEPCQCSDVDIDAALKKRASTAKLPKEEQSSRPLLNVQKRLWPAPLVQKPVVKVFGSLRYAPTTDNAYEYATTYVYEDYYPTAYYEAPPVQQKLPPTQYHPQPKFPSQPRPQPQVLPMKKEGVSLFHQPDVGVYAARVPNNSPTGGVAVGNKLLRPVKPAAPPTRTNGAAKKRVARDLSAVAARAESMCPCRTTQKPPCTKTRKKCSKKTPCTKKVKKCKKPCPKKVEQHVMPYPYFNDARIRG